jgi:TPP-dependent pyruvate/acetoin dehydrogenase alpha subunit
MAIEISKEKLFKMYKTMVRARYFENKVIEVYQQGLMPGLAHLYVGEEAVAAGACGALSKDDYITSTHRGHGHLVAKGGKMDKMMAEIFGRSTGYCKGKGGSMHICDVSLGILGANGIVGGGYTLAAGAGLSIKVRKSNQVCVCFAGDASTNQGSFHEALNLASTWKLPVVYVIENNGYGISVSQARHQNIKDISLRAVGYGIPGVTVDGNDVEAVYTAVSEAVERARKGEGPTLVECKTYRWRGHHEGDANRGGRYRTQEEILSWEKKCPIEKTEAKLLKLGIKAEEIEAYKEEVKKEVEEAVEFGKNSPWPELSEVTTDVYAE